MFPLERSSQRPFVTLLAIAAVSTLVLFSLTSVSRPTWLPASSHTVQADYLEDHQRSFNATTTAADDSEIADPWKCTCYSHDSPEPLPKYPQEMIDNDVQAPDVADSDQHIAVPNSLPAPPAELMRKIDANMADGRVLIIATANYGMRDYMYNWIESLKRTKEDKFLVFCLDDKLYAHLVNAGFEDHATTIPDEWFHQAVASDFEDYWSPLYKAITHSKTLVVQRLLYLDINVFFSDIDIVWLRPRMREYLKTLLDVRQDTHVVFQQEGLDERQVNSGFFMMRPAIDMKHMLAETILLQDSNQGLTQQGAMNRALNSMVTDIRSSSVILLDVMHFPNGFAYFDHNLSNSRGVQPYILHANYRVAGKKKEELQVRGYWYVDEHWVKEVDEEVEKTWKDKTTRSTASQKNSP